LILLKGGRRSGCLEKRPDPHSYASMTIVIKIMFIERTKIRKFYQVHEGNRDFEKSGVRVLPVRTFCKEPQLP
jgi:hypothetical protein